MPMTELKSIATLGGGMIIDAKGHSITDLKNLAAIAGNEKGIIVIKNCSALPVSELKNIAMAGKGCVILDFI